MLFLFMFDGRRVDVLNEIVLHHDLILAQTEVNLQPWQHDAIKKGEFFAGF